MFNLGDIVRVRAHPSLWGRIVEIKKDEYNGPTLYWMKTRTPTLGCEAHEIEYAPLEALADV